MQRIKGDLFTFAVPGNAIVIPGNIGWTRQGKNVMGAGVARQAAQRWPDLPYGFGTLCRRWREKTGVFSHSFSSGECFLFFPVKPLSVDAPWLSWRGPASLTLVEKSTRELAAWPKPESDSLIYLPLVGCGNGGLERAVVLPILDRYLANDRFILVETG